jgi:hypothetical protein
MKAAGLGENDAICLALPHYSNPSISLLKELKSDGLTVKKPDRCLFRGYEIRVEQSTAASIRIQLVDIRYVDTDLAVILRDGVYVIETEATGERTIRDYKALPPFDKK